MINKQLIKRKVAKLITYLKELEKLSDYEFQEYQENYLIKRATERLLVLIVEVASDLNAHLIAKITKKPAKTYFESFLTISEVGIIEKEFAIELAKSAGLRNRLIHEYEEIDDKIVYDSVQSALKDYSNYINEINRYLGEFEEKNND